LRRTLWKKYGKRSSFSESLFWCSDLLCM